MMSVILFVTFMVISLLIVVRFNMLSVNGIIESCDKSQYYQKVKEELSEHAYYVGIPYGIDEKCIENVFDEQEIKTDIRETLIAQMGNEKSLISTDKIGIRIKKNIIAKYGKLDKSKENAVNEYIRDVGEIYREKVCIPGMEYASEAIIKFNEISNKGIPLCMVIILICVGVLTWIRKYSHHGLRYVVYGAFGAGFSLMLFSASLILGGIIDAFDISSELINEFLIIHITHQLYMQFLAGFMLLIIGFIIIFIISKQRERLKYKKHWTFKL